MLTKLTIAVLDKEADAAILSRAEICDALRQFDIIATIFNPTEQLEAVLRKKLEEA